MRQLNKAGVVSGTFNSALPVEFLPDVELRIVVEQAGGLLGIQPGHTFEVGSTTTIIGRDQRSDVFLDDPAVSHRHLILNQTFGIPILENLSDQVTHILDGAPLLPGDKRALTSGSDTRILLGNILLNLQFDAPAAALMSEPKPSLATVPTPPTVENAPFLSIEWEHDRCHVRCKGKLVDLFPISARVLGLLCATPGSPVHKTELRKLIGPAPQLEQQVTYIRRAFAGLVKSGAVTKEELQNFIGTNSAGPHVTALASMPLNTLLRYFISAKRGFGYVIHMRSQEISIAGEPHYLMLQPAAPSYSQFVQA